MKTEPYEVFAVVRLNIRDSRLVKQSTFDAFLIIKTENLSPHYLQIDLNASWLALLLKLLSSDDKETQVVENVTLELGEYTRRGGGPRKARTYHHLNGCSSLII